MDVGAPELRVPPLPGEVRATTGAASTTMEVGAGVAVGDVLVVDATTFPRLS
jgi:hypothetical protein